MKICAIIPARYDSKRLPGKPLLSLNKKTILEKTYLQVAKVVNKKDIYVLTDSIKVINTLRNKIKNFILTPKKYDTGLERCAYNFQKIKKKYKGYLIVSCDFPYIPIKALNETINNYNKIYNIKEYAAATVHTTTKDKSILLSTKIPKIVLNNLNDIIYLSRSLIPSNYKKKLIFNVHHGPICVKSEALLKIKNFKYNNLSKSEENEWLKFIENGFKIRSSEVKKISREINDKKDLTFYRKKLFIKINKKSI